MLSIYIQPLMHTGSDAFAGVSGGAGGGRSMPKQYNLFNKEEQEIAESHMYDNLFL